jgi:hypothetical protein
MTASEAWEAAMNAESAWYGSYAQDALDCRAIGFMPATSQSTRDLRRDANSALLVALQLRQAEREEVAS